MMENDRERTARKVWEAALKDLLSEDSMPGSALSGKLDKMEIAINVLPDRRFREMYRESLTSLRKLSKETSESTQEVLEQHRKELQKRMLSTNLSNATSVGRRMVSERVKKERDEKLDRKREFLEQRDQIASRIAAQLKDISERDANKSSKELQDLRADLLATLESVKKGDVEAFETMEKRLSDLSSNYSVSEEIAEHLESIGKFAENETARKLERRREIRDSVKSAISSKLDGMFRSLGYFLDRKFGDLGIGPANLRNAFRVAKGAALATKFLGKASWATAKFLGKGLVRGSRAAYSYLSPSASPPSSPSPEAAPVASSASENSRRDKQAGEDNWMRRQVRALEALVKNRKVREGGGLLSMASGLISSLLGKMSFGKFLGPNLLRMLGGGGALAALAGKAGLLGLSAVAGWKIGSMLYEKFSTEILDLIESTVGFVDKIVGHVTDGLTWIGDFVSDPMKKLKSMGVAIQDAWNGSSVGKMINSAVSAVATPVAAALPSGKAMKGMAARASSNLGEISSSVSDASSKTWNAVSSAASSSWSGLTAWAGKLFNVQPGVDVENVQPAVRDRFSAMVGEYRSMGGKAPVTVTSGFRSPEKQAELYAANPRLAAPPGKSAHNFGLALDADRRGLNDMDRMGLLSKYGFERPISGEPWHLQPIGMGKSMSKAGVFSADSPTNQGGKSTAAALPQSSASPPPEASAPPKSTSSPPSAPPSRPPFKQGGSASGLSTASVPTFSYHDTGFFVFNLGSQ